MLNSNSFDYLAMVAVHTRLQFPPRAESPLVRRMRLAGDSSRPAGVVDTGLGEHTGLGAHTGQVAGNYWAESCCLGTLGDTCCPAPEVRKGFLEGEAGIHQ